MKNTLLALMALWLLSGCAGRVAKKITTVQPGMSAKEVEQTLGRPSDRTFRGNKQTWVYKHGDQKKVVVLEDGKVVEMLNAPADAKVGDIVGDQKDKNKYCVGKNKFGRFAKGGGCNMYGCWAAGGYCNQWGCSKTGNCTARGCPQKTKSYVCKD